MKPQETDAPSTAGLWSIARFFIWIWSKCQVLASWFYSHQEEYPPDEAGELMRRYMAKKSWFDKITSGWCEQSFWSKITYAAGFILVAGLVGLLAGASFLFVLTAVALTIITHTLFAAHERNRWEGARIFAAESIALNASLKKSEEFFNEVTSDLCSTHTTLKFECDALKEQVVALDVESEVVHQQNEVLITVVDDVEKETSGLLYQEKLIKEEFEAVSQDLDAYHQAIKQSKDKVDNIGAAASQFSGVVLDMQQSQHRFSDAVNNFCFFVSERPVVNTPDLDTDTDDFIASLTREVEENDTFIDEFTRAGTSWQSVH